MPTIEDVFEAALREEPAVPDFIAPAIAGARRRRRRTQLVRSAAVAAVVAGGVVALTLSRVGQTPDPSRVAAQPLTIAQLQRSARGAIPANLVAARYALAAVTDPAHSGPVTASSLPGIVEQSTDVTLTDIVVTRLRDGALNLTAAVSRVGARLAAAQDLSVEVVPAGSLTTAVPSCASLSVLPGGDGYSGPCQVRPLRGGGFAVVRSGRTASGGYTKADVDLVRADGSGILVEVSNQRLMDRPPRARDSRGRGGEPLYVVGSPQAPVSDLPPVSADELAHLVHVLDSHR